MTDLKYSFPAKLEAMKTALKTWQEDTKAKMPIPNLIPREDTTGVETLTDSQRQSKD